MMKTVQWSKRLCMAPFIVVMAMVAPGCMAEMCPVSERSSATQASETESETSDDCVEDPTTDVGELHTPGVEQQATPLGDIGCNGSGCVKTGKD